MRKRMGDVFLQNKVKVYFFNTKKKENAKNNLKMRSLPVMIKMYSYVKKQNILGLKGAVWRIWAHEITGGIVR